MKRVKAQIKHKAKRYKCIGGPCQGEMIWLGSNGESAVFKMKGESGKYASRGGSSVIWRPR